MAGATEVAGALVLAGGGFVVTGGGFVVTGGAVDAVVGAALLPRLVGAATVVGGALVGAATVLGAVLVGAGAGALLSCGADVVEAGAVVSGRLGLTDGTLTLGAEAVRLGRSTVAGASPVALGDRLTGDALLSVASAPAGAAIIQTTVPRLSTAATTRLAIPRRDAR